MSTFAPMVPFIIAATLALTSCGRGVSSKQSCVANLKQMQGAKMVWALEFHKTTNDTPSESDLFGSNRYIRNKLVCPQGGAYTIGKVGEQSQCTISMHSLQVGHVIVLNESRTAFVGASVSLPGASGHWASSSLTDSNGSAYVNASVHGATSILVVSTGYISATIPLTSSWPVTVTLKRLE